MTRRPAEPASPPPPGCSWFWCAVCGLWRAVGSDHAARRVCCSPACRRALQRNRAAALRPKCANPACVRVARQHRKTCSSACARTVQREAVLARWRGQYTGPVTKPCAVCDRIIRRRYASLLPRCCSPKCRATWRLWDWMENVMGINRAHVRRLTPVAAFAFGVRIAMHYAYRQHYRRERKAAAS